MAVSFPALPLTKSSLLLGTGCGLVTATTTLASSKATCFYGGSSVSHCQLGRRRGHVVWHECGRDRNLALRKGGRGRCRVRLLPVKAQQQQQQQDGNEGAPPPTATATATGTQQLLLQEQSQIGVALHSALVVGILVSIDRALKSVFAAASIKFPSALFGMFCIFSALIGLDALQPSAATATLTFFQPGLLFLQRWLPLFFVPSLVMLPLALRGIAPAAGLKIFAIILFGWTSTLAVTGWTAVAVRGVVQTKMLPSPPSPKPNPFTYSELATYVAVQAAAFGVAVFFPEALGSRGVTALPFFLAATVNGYVFASLLPVGVRKVFHPILICAMTAQASTLLLSMATSSTFTATLGQYLTGKAAAPGAGDLLLSLLGPVILSFAFSMYQQRKPMRRHSVEILSAVVVSSVFTLFSTALAGRMLGLGADLTRAVIPRCITVALALPIAGILSAPSPSLTAATVVTTGLVGAAFGQGVMDTLGFKDPIARGMATACSAHGLGTAALAVKEPEALPFCAIAQALTGIVSSILVTNPNVRAMLLAIVGV